MEREPKVLSGAAGRPRWKEEEEKPFFLSPLQLDCK